MQTFHNPRSSLVRAGTAILATAFLSASAFAQVPRTPAPENASVYFIEPADGATLTGPVKVVMGLSNMGVAPAGADLANTGHHHILVNVSELPPMDGPLPATDHFRHFGGGQTETTLELPAGTHTLQLLVGDHNHIPHDPPIISERITITVSP
jgi:hypothetical protein